MPRFRRRFMLGLVVFVSASSRMSRAETLAPIGSVRPAFIQSSEAGDRLRVRALPTLEAGPGHAPIAITIDPTGIRQTIVGVGGAQGTTTSFRGFGTSLMATPTVVDRDLIRISIIAEYSSLNPANNSGGIPGTNSRRIQTEVELREGQTLALAGLLSHGTSTEISRLPLLGDIPYIGPLLFSTKKSTQEENELLVLVTPEIVRPMDAHEVPPVPGFEVTKPTHEEFWKYNMTEGQPDTGYYHLPPYGSGSVGTNVDYQHFNPGPAGSMQSPVPTSPNNNFRSGLQGAGQLAPMGPSMAPGQQAYPQQSQPAPGPGRLYPIPQSSTNGMRPNSRYSNQVMSPGNNSGIRQSSYEQQSNERPVNVQRRF